MLNLVEGNHHGKLMVYIEFISVEENLKVNFNVRPRISTVVFIFVDDGFDISVQSEQTVYLLSDFLKFFLNFLKFLKVNFFIFVDDGFDIYSQISWNIMREISLNSPMIILK